MSQHDDDEVIQPSKRIILSSSRPKQQIVRSGSSLFSPAQVILADALDTVGTEIVRLNQRAKQAALNPNEARTLQGYIKSLIDINREQRENDKGNDAADMTDEELMAIAEQLLKENKK